MISLPMLFPPHLWSFLFDKLPDLFFMVERRRTQRENQIQHPWRSVHGETAYLWSHYQYNRHFRLVN